MTEARAALQRGCSQLCDTVSRNVGTGALDLDLSFTTFWVDTRIAVEMNHPELLPLLNKVDPFVQP